MKIVAKNRTARKDYELLDVYQAGISLLGQEIKSIRLGNISLDGSFVSIKGRDVFLKGMNISEYKFSNIDKPDPLRDRRLLLHRHEIRKLRKFTEQKGYSVVPISIGINKKGYAKVDIAVAKSITKRDKREINKKKEFVKERKLY